MAETAARLARWREVGSTQSIALQAATGELEGTAAFIEQTIAGLAERFTALAAQATAQSDQVGSLLEKTDRIVTPTENISTSELTDLMQRTLTQVVDRVAEMSKSAESMAAALRSVSDSVGRIDRFTTDLNRINQQTRILSLNATIEAARAGEAGRGFAVVAGEVRALSAQTAQLSQAMQTEIVAIAGAVQQGHGIVASIAAVDLDENLATRQRLGQLLPALLSRRDEIDGLIRDFAQRSGETARGISAIVGAFQFQDRSKQRMMHVADMMRAVTTLTAETQRSEPGGSDPAPPDTGWLRRLVDRFTMREVRERALVAMGLSPAAAAPAPAAAADEGELEMF